MVGYIGSKTFHKPVARHGYVPSLYFKIVCISDFNLTEFPEARELSCTSFVDLLKAQRKLLHHLLRLDKRQLI